FYRVKRANSKSRHGMHAEAIADFDEAIRLAPGEASAYFHRGIEWYRNRDVDKAIFDFTKAIDLDTNSVSSYAARGTAWKSKAEFERARADYTAAARVQPEAWLGHHELARFLATCRVATFRDGKRAVAEATRACELTNWKNAARLDTLAAAYAES